ncbi:MAG TPA: glycosyltransferase family 39 protein [Candidatus Angelobacter sp.]|nr:glycosyltransferase family 39 protein [Candidatus Angelobacter sp.]
MKKLIALVRQNWLFFLLATLAALALRFFFVFRLPHLAGDTWIYGDIARNWLNHGVFGVTDDGMVRPTLIRLPGYPAFLAAIFAIFGHEHYRAVLIAQALIDTNTCLVIAGLALELMNSRAAKAAYLLAALCPFTANYVAAPLSETLSIFCVAHAMYYGVRGLKALQEEQFAPLLWLPAGLWTAAAILMRPDNGVLLPALGLALAVFLIRTKTRKQAILAGALVAVASLTPLVPWTVRNWRVFHQWQPLASRYANDPGEFVPRGFNHWIKTWLVDFVSVDEVYWKVSGEPLDLNSIPQRAFDNWPEYQKTQDLISRYNQQLYIDPQMDAEFDQLAQARVESSPLRYSIWLPTLRMADMWLRPRTEMLDVETRWWEFDNHPRESWFALVWATINLLYILAALRGWLLHRLGAAGIFLVGFVVIRTLFLSSLENPEPRYVLECFPVILALAGGAFTRNRDAKVANGSSSLEGTFAEESSVRSSRPLFFRE